MNTALLDREIARQQAMIDALPILADLTRSDVLFLDGKSEVEFSVEFHAQPQSIISLYAQNAKGKKLQPSSESAIVRAFKSHKLATEVITPKGERMGTARREAWPVLDQDQLLIGIVLIETARVEHESQQRRGKVYVNALTTLKEMGVRGDLRGTKELSRSTASEGVIVVGRDLTVQYTNGFAQEIFERVGISQSIKDRRLGELETGDHMLVSQAFETGTCIEREDTVLDKIWVRRVIPLIDTSARNSRKLSAELPPMPPVRGAILTVHDVTAIRQEHQEKEHLATVSKEIHHRVKNNLQQIISLARIEARRAQLPETKRALSELANSVFAIAQLHEYLSANSQDAIQLKDIAKQIAREVRENLLPKDSHIAIEVEGDPLKLDHKQATWCVLIINELVQNAVEHAFDEKGGVVRVQLEDSPERVRIAVVDNGRGLPPGFEWRHSDTMGLKIIHTMVPGLKGEFKLRNQELPAHGLIAQLTFSKQHSKGQ